MSSLPVYKFEVKAGLEDLITASASACVIASITDSPNIDLDKIAEARKLHNFSDKDTEYNKQYLPPDMMQVNAILASTTWNGNDDVFTPDETIKAERTAQLKPVNIDHKGKEIDGVNQTIGVIAQSYAVDSEYKYFSFDQKEPNKPFHILASAYLWEKYFPEAVGNLKKAIDKKEQFVSMECLFKDFGYALKKEGSDVINLLPRNEITSWMTASLRAYKGTGSIKIDGTEYRIGRWLKGFVFSGMGFVKKPANGPSIVFEDYLSHASMKFQTVSEDLFVKKEENGVLEFSIEGTLALWL
jgi:hypothetical protein